jgi:hypothetical protein
LPVSVRVVMPARLAGGDAARQRVSIGNQFQPIASAWAGEQEFFMLQFWMIVHSFLRDPISVRRMAPALLRA